MRPLTEAENKNTEFKTELDIEYKIQLEAIKIRLIPNFKSTL